MHPVRADQRAGRLLLLGALLVPLSRGNAAEPGHALAEIPANFKLEIAEFGVGQEPTETVQLLSHQGRLYRISTELQEEVLVYDPALERVDLLDLKRHIQSEVSIKRVEQAVAKLHGTISQAITRREKAGGRANEIAAAISRDLIDPHFKETFDPAGHRLLLTNSTVEGTAVGTPEPDPVRLSQIGRALKVFLELDAIRDPDSIPPFARLSAMNALIETHRLRPTELSFLYRVAGKPERRRSTYRLVPGLTARETEGISRINNFRARTAFVRFDRYEFPDDVAPAVPR